MSARPIAMVMLIMMMVTMTMMVQRGRPKDVTTRFLKIIC